MHCDDVVQDANVGAHIFKNGVKGKLLRGRTCVMVTNQLHVLPEFDFIYVMKDGKISECGKYDQLMAGGTDLKQLIAAHTQTGTASDAPSSEVWFVNGAV